MPAPFSADFYNFTGGLHTDAGALRQPPNTWREGVNITPMNDGSVERRPGIDKEYDAAAFPAGGGTNTRINTDAAFAVHEWLVPTNDDSIIRLVVYQNGAQVHVLKITGDPMIAVGTPVKSTVWMLLAIQLGDAAVSASKFPAKIVSSGRTCWVVAQNWAPIRFVYDPNTDNVTTTQFTNAGSIRDFEGVDDGLAVDNQPVALSATHWYNLINQGWYADGVARYTSYFGTHGRYPSNTQVWHYGKDATNNYSSTELVKVNFGTSLAPRGFVITKIWNRRNEWIATTGGSYNETERFRFATAEYYAGRFWAAGLKESKLTSWVFFSQVLGSDTSTTTSDPVEFRFYQKGDPTAEIGSELLPDDGGYIVIREAGYIHDLASLGDSLIVFGANGVWAIRPGSDIGFTADSYYLDKISSNRCVSKTTVQKADDAVFFWAEEGICAVVKTQFGFEVKNLSENRINNEYLGISYIGKVRANAAYNNEDRVVVWCYDEDAAVGDTYPGNKHCLMFYDIGKNAFYTYKLQRNTGAWGPTILAPMSFLIRASVADSSFAGRGFKFLSLGEYLSGAGYFTFADFRALNKTTATNKFKDWATWYTGSTPESYSAYFITGHVFAPSNPTTRKTPMYVTTFFKKTETGVDGSGNAINDSSVTLETRWDFSETATANKWSDPVPVYKHVRPRIVVASATDFDTGHELVVTKNKVRGRGRAVALKFSAVGDKDMKLLGWSTMLKANDNV